MIYFFLNSHHFKNIGDDAGALKIPRFSKDITFKLMVNVGLEEGSGLICLLQHDPTLVLMGFEAHQFWCSVSQHASLKSQYQLN
jgi:hypothetical protein